MPQTSTIERLRARLTQTFKPLQLDIVDDSHKHVGHAGAAKGGHFRVFIVAEAFDGRSLIGRHRMVYEAVAENLRSDVHALSIVARAPSEVNEQPPATE